MITREWERYVTNEFERKVVYLHGTVNSYKNSGEHLLQMYGAACTSAFSSKVTDVVFFVIEQRRNCPFGETYSAIYLVAIHYKVGEDRKVVTKAVYSVYGVNMAGHRDVLGLFIGEAEGARHWVRILENFRDLWVKDVFFFCFDGLNGFSQAIAVTFFEATPCDASSTWCARA